MTKRNDPHRPGAIVPANYRYVMSYNLATSMNGWPVPSYGVNCQLDRRHETTDAQGKRTMINGEHDASGLCCIVGMLNAGVPFAAHGSTGKCTICGAHFVYGDVWAHEATGEHIHVGHTCSDKYSMLTDRSAYEMERKRFQAARAKEIIREQKQEERQAFLAAHDGLADALAVDHHIIRDIASRFQTNATLSEKQIALVFKLAHEVKNPRPAEVTVPAPEGRLSFQGTVVSIKAVDSDYGTTLKLVVKVTTDAGVWLCYVTKPSNWSLPEGWPKSYDNIERGDVVELTATLKRGRDPHFALGKRPTKARLVSRPAAASPLATTGGAK